MAEESAQQQRFAAVAFYAFLAILAYFVYRIFRSFIAPLCWAAVLVVVFEPLNARLVRRWGKTWAATCCTLLVTLILIGPTISVGAAFIHQGIEAAADVQHAMNAGGLARFERVWVWLTAHVPGQTPANLAELAHRAIGASAEFLAARIGYLLRNTAIFFFDLAITIVAMFYLFRDGARLMYRLRQLLPFEDSHRELMFEKTRSMIFASVTSSLAAAGVHGLFGGLAFAIAGIPGPVFWGVVMAFFSLLPVVGDLVIWIPAILGLFAEGHWGYAILLVVMLTLAGLIDGVMRPIFISGRARMSGLVVFISVIGGIEVFGLLGVILGPIVVALAATVLEIHSGPKTAPRTAHSNQ